MQVVGLAGLGCLMPVLSVGCTLLGVGFAMVLGRTRLGVGPLKQFAQDQGLDIAYPTLLSPTRSPRVVLPDGSSVRAAVGQHPGPHLLFLMPTGGPSRFHLGPGGQVVRALRRTIVGDADVVDLEGTNLGDGWRCLCPAPERGLSFVMDAGRELEALLTEAGAKGLLEFTADNWWFETPTMVVVLPAGYGTPGNVVGVTLDRMRALRARWEATAQS